MQIVVGALFWNFGSTHWTRSVRRRSWPWHKNFTYQALNSSHGPWSCRELSNPPTCCRVPAERDMCAYGCICVVAVAAPRRLFITSWCLRATCRRFRPHREERLRSSFSLVLPLSFLIACLRPYSPACHRRGRRHRGGCASFAVARRSISLTCPLHSFKRIFLRVQLIPQERTSMRIVEQMTNKSSKTSINVIFQARKLRCTVGQIVTCPFHSSWK